MAPATGAARGTAMLALCTAMLALHVPATAAAASAAGVSTSKQAIGATTIWAAGNYTHLAVAADYSFTLTVGSTLSFSAKLPAPVPPGTQPHILSGSSQPWGPYTELTLLVSPAAASAAAAGDGSANSTAAGAQQPTFPSPLYSWRYYSSVDAFVLTRLYLGGNSDNPFPWFTTSEPTNSTNVGVVGYRRSYMLSGDMAPALQSCTNKTDGDGPLFLFENSGYVPAARPSLALSALDGFSQNAPACDGPAAAFGMRASVPAGGSVPADTALASIIVGRPGLKRATVAWGAFMRQFYGTTRRRSTGVSQLSYWSDNAAGYSFWSTATNLSLWGQPQDLFQQLRAGYKALGIPVKQWEIDCNLVGEAGFAGGWCWKDWRHWNTSLFPAAGNLSRDVLGGDQMAFYVSSFCNDTVHRAEGFDFVGVDGWPHRGGPVAIVHPNDAYAFYKSILTTARDAWGMQMLFTDFLCFRGPSLGAALPSYFQASHEWLRGMTMAAQDLGMEIQYCMACAHQAMESLQWPAVTNARVNGDGGMDVPDLTYSSIMAAAVGLGWSKDNLRLAVFSEGDTRIQTLFAALSLGPVGLSDELQGYPTPPQATGTPVVTNVTLAMSTTTTNGTLLQPSFPLTPVEDQLVGVSGLGADHAHVWATYTVVRAEGTRASGASPANVWFAAVGFNWTSEAGARRRADRDAGSSTSAGDGSDAPATAEAEVSSFALTPDHIAPLLDTAALPPADFSDIPVGTYLGAGQSLPAAQYMAWDPDAAVVTVAPFGADAPARLALADHMPQQINIAPVLGGVVLLGEQGKAAAVSSYRFASVVEQSGPGDAEGAAASLVVSLRGAPGEGVTLLYATAPSYQVQESKVTLGADGTTQVSLPPALQ